MSDVIVFSLSWYQGCIYPVIPNKHAIVGVHLFLEWPVLVFWLWRHTSVCLALCSRYPCDVLTVTFSRLWFNRGPTVNCKCWHIFGPSLCHHISSHAGLMLTHRLRRWPNIKPAFFKLLCLLGGRWSDNIATCYQTLLAQAGKVGWPSGI